MAVVAEYIWIDGGEPVKQVRSKTKCMVGVNIATRDDGSIDESQFPDWGFDGSSTGQAPGDNSDCKLRPARVVTDPIRGGDSYLVLCEVLIPETGKPHPTNQRAELVRVMNAGGRAEDEWGRLRAPLIDDVLHHTANAVPTHLRLRTIRIQDAHVE